MTKTLLVTAALLAVTTAVHADIDCWLDAPHPRTADGLASTDARVAPLQRALQQLNAVLHAQPALQALPRTRLRSSWQIAGQWALPARAAHFLLRDHRESMWQGACGLHPGADRLSPRATLVVQVNAPETFFASAVPELRDEQLSAWRELLPSGQVQGRTLYDGHMLVITPDGRRPWVPVTVAEYLDFMERELQRQHEASRAAAAQQQAAMAPAQREADIRRVVDGMRRVDPVAAQQLEAQLRASLAAEVRAIEDAAARRAARGQPDDPVKQRLEKLRAHRARLSAAELAAQARLGVDGLETPGPLERHPLLARPDPAYPWDRARPARPQMLMVSVRGGAEFEAPMAEVLRRLDLAALEALVRP